MFDAVYFWKDLFCHPFSKMNKIVAKCLYVLFTSLMELIIADWPCRYRTLKNTLLSVHCENRGLNQIPTFPNNSDVINLSDNDIVFMDALFPTDATAIDLSRNKIRSLRNKPFIGLHKLKILNLRNNYIRFDKLNFYDGLFSSLEHLQELDLKGNCKSGIMDSEVDETYADLKALEILKIDAQKDFYFGLNFRKLRNLRNLDLSGTTGYCDMRVIRETTFNNLQYLQFLDISACNINLIESSVFAVLKNLNYLDISQNEQIGFASLPNITSGMNRTSIRVLKLNSITCPSGRSTILKREHLINLVNTSVLDLSVENNRIEVLHLGVLSNLPKTIKRISLAGNRLIIDDYVLEFQTLLELKILDLSSRFTAHGRNEGVLKGILSSCNPKVDRIKSLISKNDESRIMVFKNASKVLKMHFPPLPPKLEILCLNSSRVFFKFLEKMNLEMNNLKHVYLQNNMIKAWRGSIASAEKLISIDISWNYCWRISKMILQTLHRLERLNLKHNILHSILRIDVKGKLFEKQRNLKYLDLANNRIRNLHPMVFKNLINLEVLILANNQLSEWLVSVGHMTKLKRLDLSQNRLSTTAPQFRYDIDIFSSSNLLNDIRMHGNPFQCSCANLGFLRWMALNENRFKPFRNYRCSIRSSDSFDFYDIHSSVSTLEEKCKLYTKWYILGSIMTSIIISAVCGVFTYRQRWKMRYLRYTLKQTIMRKFDRTYNLKKQDLIDFEYDAYISYTGRDRDFVVHELIPNLETKMHMKLLIRDRTFLPGESKAHQILQSIQKCKKTICVISENYLKSDWRDYELNMARVEGIEARKSLSFVQLILLPEVYNGEYPKQVMDLVKKRCYIEYPDEPAGYEEFWNNLKSII